MQGKTKLLAAFSGKRSNFCMDYSKVLSVFFTLDLCIPEWWKRKAGGSLHLSQQLLNFIVAVDHSMGVEQCATWIDCMLIGIQMDEKYSSLDM